ncbi:hypothetical protein EVAR_61378_1 [Eumeta japonica]|uniref:Histone-lysine N-methyltransferase SETMAR n=1 Tax=Eumeta variegata TaxID=151549 RepID=A0A4C1ZC50_EUMVA|nr:hypothetical protein EVAR_61378_1 [Eumeta japonica]
MRHKPQKNCDIYGPNAVMVKVNWFKHFQSGHFDVKDEPYYCRPVTDKMNAILEKVEQDQNINSYDIVEELGIDRKTILTHFEKAGYKKARYLGLRRAH